MIWLLRNIILAIHSEKSRWQLAFGAVLGWFLGMLPLGSFFWLAMLLLLLITRTNIAMAIVFATFGKALIFIVDMNAFGRLMLEMGALQGFWTWCYNTPYLAISDFNRSDVMGGFFAALAMSIATMPFLLQITKLYHQHILVYVEKFWIIKALKGSKFFQWYMGIADQ